MFENDKDNFNALIDNEAGRRELTEREKAELREYAKFVKMLKERTSYRPSESAKLKTLSKIRHKKLLPYRIALATVTSFVVLILGLSFFMENSILITPKPVFLLNNGKFDSARSSLLSSGELSSAISSTNEMSSIESSMANKASGEELKKHLETTIDFITNEKENNPVVLSTSF